MNPETCDDCAGKTVKKCKLHKLEDCSRFPPHCRNCGNYIIKIRDEAGIAKVIKFADLDNAVFIP